MLIVDGFKMWEGKATFRFQSSLTGEPKLLTADSVFLYRPDEKLWYVAPCKEFPWGCTFKKDELVEIVEGGKTAV